MEYEVQSTDRGLDRRIFRIDSSVLWYRMIHPWDTFNSTTEQLDTEYLYRSTQPDEPVIFGNFIVVYTVLYEIEKQCNTHPQHSPYR